MEKKLEKYKNITILLGISLILIGTIIQTSYGKTDYTRSEVEDIVTSTALSYYYNGKYSDYSQKSMDNATGTYKNSIRYRNLNLKPESINRNNQYFIDCSSFVTSVYIHSLGYDFSNYYAFSNTKYLSGLYNISYTYQSKNNYTESYKVNGSGINTAYFNNFSSSISETSDGEEYINNNLTNKSPLVYYYSTTLEESTSEQNSIINNIKTILRKGDILVYRHTSGGHAIMYVGDSIDGSSTTEKIIHSNGGDYKELYNSVKNGSMENIEGIFSLSGKELLSVMIIRPINEYCTSNSCTLTSDYANKGSARVDLKKLRTEAYTSTKKEYDEKITKYIGKYNSINNGDEVTYNLEMENMSNAYICTNIKLSGAYHNEEECTSAGGTWRRDNGTTIEYIGQKKYNSNTENLIGLTIKAKIPEGSSFVSCNNCRIENDTLIWDNFDKISKPELSSSYSPNNFYYTVKVNTDDEKLINEGIELITSNGNSIIYDDLNVNINPSLTKENITNFTNTINKIKNLYSTGKLTYNVSSTDSPLVDIDTITNISLPGSGMIKLLYYNELGIDLTSITNSQIKQALFSQNGNDYMYYEPSTTENSKKIQTMLVPGLYGGEYLRGNIKNNRTKYIRAQDLEYGDILIFYSQTSSLMSPYLYIGMTGEEISSTSDEQAKFLHFGKNGFTEYTGLSAHSLIHNAFSSLSNRKDLFLVLRPSRLGTSTVIYNSNNEEENTSYVAYETYKNLKTPSKISKITYKENSITLYEETYKNAFQGWYSDSTLKEQINNNTKIENKTQNIYAKYNEANITLKNITKEGYILKGWYEDENLTKKAGEQGEVYKLSENKTLYAKYEKKKVTISFNTNEGSQISPIEGTPGDKVTKPNNPEKEGYTFAGWYEDENLTKLYTIDTFPKENITLYAKWIQNSYIIEYNLNGGINNINNPTSYNAGETKQLYEPTKTGYNFLGWYTDSTFQTKIEQINENKNITLYAKWEKKTITITLEANNGITLPSIKGLYGEEIKTITTPEKEGYTFLGWYDKTLENKQTINTFPENDITLYAKWEKITYTITCQIGNDYITKKYDIETELTIENPEKKGYNFLYWEENNNTYQNITIKKGTTGNKTYKAVFEPIKYYIIYNSNDETNQTIKEQFTYDKLQGLKAPFEREKYTFLGWNITRETKKPQFTQNQGLDNPLNLTDQENEEITLYAIWNKTEIDVEVNVINGISSKTNIVANQNEAINIDIFPNTGYSNPQINCTNNQTGTITNNKLTINNLTNDTICTIKYEPIKYQITYNLDGGELKNGIYTYTIEDEITLTSPEKKGYEFIGWTNDAITVAQKTITIKNQTGNKNYIANYKTKTYKITYSSDEYGTITGITEEEKQYKESPSGTTKEVQEEYKTLKWAADCDVTLKDGTTIKKGDSLTNEQIKNIIIENDINIKAYHYITKYKITYKKDENTSLEGITEEEVSSGQNPLGTSLKAKTGYEITSYIANKDITLVTGETIEKGFPINDITKIIVTEDLEIMPKTELITYKINYICDKNCEITGQKEEQTNIKITLTGTKYKAKTGYEITSYIANKDVIINNKTIKQGTKIKINQLTKTTPKNDATIKIITQKIKYTINYISSNNTKITGKTKEQIAYKENPTGTKVKALTNENALIWTANKDVTLKNGKTIKKGNYITNEEIKTIVVKENLILKANEKIIKSVSVPNTSSNKGTIITLLGTILVILGSYFILEKKQEQINKR